MNHPCIKAACTAVYVLLANLPAQAQAPVAAAQGQEWLALSDSALDRVRGGFSNMPGVMVSFGILRTVHINGALASSTGFQVPDLRSITPAEARQLGRQAAAISLVQSGSGNAFTTPFLAGTPGVVIQNTLNDQMIKSTTEINAASNGMSILKGINFSQTLHDALRASRP